MSKTSYAFNTYAYNHFEEFTKPLKPYLGGYFKTTNQLDEIEAQNAICKYLANQIMQQIPSIEDVKSKFHSSIKLLSKQKLDAIEFSKKYERRETKLKTYMKLHFALNDIADGNYELKQACYLMAIYSKVISIETKPNGKRGHYGKITKIPLLKGSLIYRYLDNAMRENKNHITMLQLSSVPMEQLVNKLYLSMAILDFNTDPDLLTTYPKNNNEINEIVEEEMESDKNIYAVFLKAVEQDFNTKLTNEMHTQNNGMTF